MKVEEIDFSSISLAEGFVSGWRQSNKTATSAKTTRPLMTFTKGHEAIKKEWKRDYPRKDHALIRLHNLLGINEIYSRYRNGIQNLQFQALCIGSRQSADGKLVFFLVVHSPGLRPRTIGPISPLDLSKMMCTEWVKVLRPVFLMQSLLCVEDFFNH